MALEDDLDLSGGGVLDLSGGVLDLSGVLGIDFVNTVLPVRGAPMDLLERPEGFLSWMALAGGEELTRFAPVSWSERRTLTREARVLRQALRSLFAAVASRSALSPTSAFVVDRALRAASASFSLAPLTVSGPAPPPEEAVATAAARRGSDETPASRPELVRSFDGPGPLAALTPIALSAVEVAANADPDRLRACDAPGCGRWFVDTSRGGQRRWCSMKRCGNRMKAARYRARQADDAT